MYLELSNGMFAILHLGNSGWSADELATGMIAVVYAASQTEDSIEVACIEVRPIPSGQPQSKA